MTDRKTDGQDDVLKRSVVTILKQIPLFSIVGMTFAWAVNTYDAHIMEIVGMPESATIAPYGLAFILIAVFSDALKIHLSRSRNVKYACLCGGVGMVLELLSHVGLPSDAAFALAAFIALALFQCFFMLYFIIRISCLPMMDALISLTIWQALMAVPAFTIIFLLPYGSLFFMAGLTIMMALQALRYEHIPEPGFTVDDECDSGTRPWSALPWRLLIAQFILLASLHAMRSFLPDGVSEITYVGFFAAGFLVITASRARKRLFALRAYYNASFVLAELSFLLLALLPEGLVLAPGIIGDASYAFFAILNFTIYGNICMRFHVNPTCLFSLVFAMEHFGNITGSAFKQITQSIGLEQSPALLLLAFIVVICFICFFREQDFRSTWNADRKNDSTHAITHYYSSIADRCIALARQDGLSRREEEVLLLLAQRKTAQDIASELYISVPTVKSHTQHIYQKLNVHSRKELLALIGYPKPEKQQ